MRPTSVADKQMQPYRQTANAVIAGLDTDAQHGLRDAEARERLARYGKNALEALPPVPAWRRLLAQFQDVLVLLLLLASAISTVVWLYERSATLPYEALVIFAIVLLNGILGYAQEERAGKAVAALRAMSAAMATVIRNGERRSVPAAEVVPGDVLVLAEGDVIPADARLIQAIALHTSEAALTGESLPVAKHTRELDHEVEIGDRHNMLFSGTAVTYGRGLAVVTATGMQTEIGSIAVLLQQTESEPTPLQQELDRTGKFLGLIVVLIAAAMIVTLLLVAEVRDFTTVVDVLLLGVALAVAAVPEGLPAVVTAVLALGVQRMAGRNAIVRHLPAVETLGSATVIASDKTGTLTRNEMTVRVVVTASRRVSLSGTGYTPTGELQRDDAQPLSEPLRDELERLFIAASLDNNAVLQEQSGHWTVVGDPTEGALLVAARKAGLELSALQARFRRVGEVPFSSERKRMSTLHTDAEHPEQLLLYTKGAADVLLSCCTQELIGAATRELTEARRAEIRAVNAALASDALRTLGVAFRTLPTQVLATTELDDRIENALVFIGLIGMLDPPRHEAKDAVARARGAGVRPIMITGDHPQTAEAIAVELGISAAGQRAMSGAELAQCSDDELVQCVRDTSVYARVNPEHKLRIVRALQRSGAVVAMTGDGVNDAPALKSADIGVAMGITGTDVSKEAADMVLTDDNFASIVAAIEEGRSIFANIQKFLRYLLSSNIGEVLTMFLGVVLADVIGLRGSEPGLVLPLLATQILWINLVTDGLPALALGMDPADPEVMQQAPRAQRSGVITLRMWSGIALVGIIMACGTLLVLDASLPGGLIAGTGTLSHAQARTFTTLVLFQLFNVFNARSDTQSAFRSMFRNGWLWGAVALSLGLHALVLYVPLLQKAFNVGPLSLYDWLLCVGVASSVLWLRELSKLCMGRST